MLQHTLRIPEAAEALTPVLADLPTVEDRRQAAHLLALAHLHSGLDLSDTGIQSVMADAARHRRSPVEVGTAEVVAAASATTYSETAHALAEAADAFLSADLRSYLETVYYLAGAQYLAGDEQASLSTLRGAMLEVEGVPPEFELYGQLFATLTAYILGHRGEWTTAESLLRDRPWPQHPLVQNYRTIVSDRLRVLMKGDRPCWPVLGADQVDVGSYGPRWSSPSGPMM